MSIDPRDVVQAGIRARKNGQQFVAKLDELIMLTMAGDGVALDRLAILTGYVSCYTTPDGDFEFREKPRADPSPAVFDTLRLPRQASR